MMGYFRRGMGLEGDLLVVIRPLKYLDKADFLDPISKGFGLSPILVIKENSTETSLPLHSIW